MTMNPKEVATLEVRGALFTDWKSVHVSQRYAEYFPTFQFEATEDSPVPTSMDKLRILPGDIVSVMLGGEQAVLGYVEERHVGYDGRNHGVRLVGVGKTYDIPTSSVPLDKLGKHDGKNFKQLAEALIGHLGISIKEDGNVDGTPFEQIQVLPGETIAATLERYARMRKIVLGSTQDGKLALIGERSPPVSAQLVEGENILRANVVIRDNYLFKKIFIIGQRNSNDQTSGDQSNKQIASVDGTSKRNRHQVLPAEIADKQHGIQQRAQMEKLFTEGLNVEAHITVQGWFKPGGSLWRAGEHYFVKSPMLVMEKELACRTATFEQQDGGGTTTTLEMVQPIHLNGRPDLSGRS